MAEKKKGWSLADAMKGVSNLDTGAEGREQIEYIERKRIQPDERNFYSLDGVEELATNIQFAGLQQPLRLRLDEKLGGMYRIVSGHRRFAAIKILAKEDPQRWERVACIVERQTDATDEVEGWLQELRLIYANSDTRTMTSADLSRQAEKVETLLYQLKEAGMEFPGRMRDHVAAACKVSAPKLARLKVIREGLIPEYKTEWEKGKLGESAAYVVARLPADFQARLYKVLASLPGHAGNADKLEEVRKKFEEGWDWNPCLTCPDGKECKRGDTFLRRDCTVYAYEGLCGGKTCCLKCDKAKRDWSPCEQMCSKAKALRKEKNDKKKEADEKRGRKILEGYRKTTQKNAQRLMPAIERAGLKDRENIPWRDYGGGCTVKQIRQWAEGDFSGEDPIYGAKLDPERLDNPAKVAKLLGVSTDWLLGMTEDMTPPTVAAVSAPIMGVDLAGEPAAAEEQDIGMPQWRTGTPKAVGPYYCAVDLSDGAGEAHLHGVYWWNGEEWLIGRHAAKLSFPVIVWWPVPKEWRPEEDDDEPKD